VSQLLSKVTDTSCSFYIKCSICKITARRHIQADDATDQWRHQWNVATLSDILQGSVATHLRCGGIFSDSTIAKCFLDSHSETISKVD